MSWRQHRIIAFDTETTGLNPHGGDRIIEFAAVEMFIDPQGKVTEVIPYQQFFNPGFPIPRKVVEITGIDDDDVADAPKFSKHAKEIAVLLEDSILVAHNFPFDRNFLTAEFIRCGMAWPDAIAEIDTVDLSHRCFPQAKGHKLELVARRLAVPLDRAHRATDDAEACGRCFVEMTRQFANSEETEALDGLLEWADALGRPPNNDYLARTESGLCFTDGPHAGEPVDTHPLHLQWMLIAQDRVDGRWTSRFPASLRRWSERYLRLRASGRARQNAKSFGADDWTLDSNALPLVSRSHFAPTALK